MNASVDRVVANGAESITEGVFQLEEREGFALGQLGKHEDRSPIQDPINLQAVVEKRLVEGEQAQCRA